MAALPLALGSMFKKAYGKTSLATDVINALNFALEFEYFQYNFYHTANSLPDLIPPSTTYTATGNEKNGFISIENHEQAHILFLNGVITTLGGVPFTPNHYNAAAVNPLYIPTAYDFTMSGTYSTFNDYPSFLMMAAVFEDTGIHALKGQIPTLFGNSDILGQAFQIQSTEGRHAAHVRTLRRLNPINAAEIPAPWIGNNIPPIIALQNYYLGEDNTMQVGGIDITTLPDTYSPTGYVPKISATAAFDESYDITTAQALIAPFLLP